MKKLWILFTALAFLVVAFPMFAVDHALTGDFEWLWNSDDSWNQAGASVPLGIPGGQGLNMARIETTSKLDDFNTILTEVRFIGNFSNFGELLPTLPNLKMFKLTTDITGALGLSLPFTLKSMAGIWEEALTQNWNQDRAGYTWVNGDFDKDTSRYGGAQLDLGVGPVIVSYFQDFSFGNAPKSDGSFYPDTQIGAHGTIGPVGVSVEYGFSNARGFGAGEIGVEAKYATELAGIALAVAPEINYDLKDQTLDKAEFKWDVGLSAAYSMFKVAAGINGRTDKAVDKIDVEAKVAPIANLAIWAAMYMKLSATNALQGVDLMASYKFGVAEFVVGYVIAGTDKSAIPIHGGDVSVPGGFYLGVVVSPF